MPIVSADIDFFLSGGAGNTVPDNSLGGVISTTQIIDNTLHNLFDLVTGDESLAGDTNYRGMYIVNSHVSLTLESAIVWIDLNTTNTEIAIALAGEGLDATMETIADEDTAPVGEVFTQPATKGAGLSLGNIPFGQKFGLWERRVIGAATSAEDNATFHIKVEGDTAA